MKRSSRILTSVLSLILSICILNIAPLIAHAAESDENPVSASSGITGDCTWNLNNGILTISGNGKMLNYGVHLESGANSFSVQTLAPWGSKITEVIIENGVTNIGIGAFAGCKNLTNVSIGNTISIIDNGAFGNCNNLSSIEIPDSVTTIETCAFANCINLKRLDIPSSVISIAPGFIAGSTTLNNIL